MQALLLLPLCPPLRVLPLWLCLLCYAQLTQGSQQPRLNSTAVLWRQWHALQHLTPFVDGAPGLKELKRGVGESVAEQELLGGMPQHWG